MSDVWQKLAEPFAWDDIKVMPQTLSKNKDKAKATPYFDARAVMGRLDEVLGPPNWKAEYREVHLPKGELGILCRLTVKVDGCEVVREDGCDLSDIEPLKGGISGALKRAFSALGNRTLYETDLGWQAIETYEGKNGPAFKDWTDDAKRAMRAKYESQVGISRKPEPRHVPNPTAAKQEAQRLSEASTAAQAPSAPEGKIAFGYVPVRWPLPKMFNEPATEGQANMIESRMRERMIPEEILPVVRRLVMKAYGLEDDGSKAAASLFIDWLMNAGEDPLDQSVAAAESFLPGDPTGDADLERGYTTTGVDPHHGAD